jgi:hypothetical protein
MKIIKTVVLVCIFLGVSAVPSHANLLYTGNDLWHSIEACARIEAQTNPPVGSDTYACAALDGYMEGTTDVLNATGLIVVPNKVTLGQEEGMLKLYLSMHPEERNKPASLLVYATLVAAWPPKVSSGVTQ